VTRRLADRSSRPIRMPQHASKQAEQKVLAARRRLKRGAVVLAAELGPNPSTVRRIRARHEVPHLSVTDPITGESVRSSRRSAHQVRVHSVLIMTDPECAQGAVGNLSVVT
jgi:hypothetical protein